MRQPLFGDKKTTMQMLTLLIACILTVIGVEFIAEHGRPTFYYLTGNVVSVGENEFCITVVPDESHVDTPLSKGVYCFEMQDFQSKYYIPEIGDTVRITCNHDMSILIGIYNANSLSE